MTTDVTDVTDLTDVTDVTPVTGDHASVLFYVHIKTWYLY